VPVETGYFSLHGLTKMMETLEMMKEKAGKDILIRVLPTLYDTRTKLAREVLNELRSKFADYLMESTVNFNTKLKEAASFGQPITEYDPGSRGYKDFVNLARELMGQRPTDVEATPTEALSRPAELVQRAKQLAQLTTQQFGKNVTPAQPATNGSLSLEASNTRLQTMGLDQAAASTPMITPKTTEQKLCEFYGVKQIGDEVVFAAKFDARKVLIAGDFNNWSPMSTPMAGNSGEWSTRLPLPKGRYRYRFVVDGKWMTDPHNNYVETNQFGELNNVVEVD
jgi:chromosome partitioning protein